MINDPLIAEAEICNTEKELFQKAFKIISSYPLLLLITVMILISNTFTPDRRIQELILSKMIIPKDEIPIIIKRETFIKRGAQAEPVQIKHGLHIDLFRTFQNRF